MSLGVLFFLILLYQHLAIAQLSGHMQTDQKIRRFGEKRFAVRRSDGHDIAVLPTRQQRQIIPQSLGAKVDLIRLREENVFLPNLDELRGMIPRDQTGRPEQSHRFIDEPQFFAETVVPHLPGLEIYANQYAKQYE